ncbi:hypothetical protein PIB30_049658 [Stylosanthes scabra]|uniref:Uncharacterized protein n=1 Tax=Stylosanthes scabra TaxID=79078 RepID=A0ABU6SID9_9FABA|nr:hypothetical protein [Stylosanthes scabra]
MAENPDRDQGATAAAAVQVPQELSPLYRAPGSSSVGGDLERRYRVEVTHRGERVCFMNLDHSRVPHWLWVNEVMFIDFGIRVPFTDLQQRLLNRACIAPSQLHPNAWTSI